MISFIKKSIKSRNRRQALPPAHRNRSHEAKLRRSSSLQSGLSTSGGSQYKAVDGTSLTTAKKILELHYTSDRQADINEKVA